MLAQIALLRRSGTLKTLPGKKSDLTETQLIFSSSSSIQQLPSVALSRLEQKSVEDCYLRIKRQFNLFPVSQLSRLFTECGIGTLQWVTIAAAMLRQSDARGWTTTIGDIAAKMADALGKICAIRDDQQTPDKQIAAVIENASAFGVPVLRHVQALLHSPEIDEDQLDGERPAPTSAEAIQAALVLLVCEAEGSSFFATAEVMTEQRAEITRQLQMEIDRKKREEKERVQRLASLANNNNNSSTINNGNNNNAAFQNLMLAKELIKNKSLKKLKNSIYAVNAFSNNNKLGGSNNLDGLTNSGTLTDNNNDTKKKESSPQQQHQQQPVDNGDDTNKNNSENNSLERNYMNNTNNTSVDNNNNTSTNSKIDNDKITAASLVSNPNNTPVPLQDILLAVSRLKHVATACECIISTIPVVLLDQIQKLAKNLDAVPPKKSQCVSIITTQVGNIYARALHYFSNSMKEDPAGENPSNASYIEFSEQVGLLAAIMDLGTDPRGLPVIPISSFGAEMEEKMLLLQQKQEQQNQKFDNSFGDFYASSPTGDPSTPFDLNRKGSMYNGFGGSGGDVLGMSNNNNNNNLFKVGSSVIAPMKSFHESAYFGGSGLQRLQLRDHLQREESFMKKQQSYYDRLESGGGIFTPVGSGANFPPGENGDPNNEHHSIPCPRQTFESPLRKQTISSIAQNFGLLTDQQQQQQLLENNNNNNISSQSLLSQVTSVAASAAGNNNSNNKANPGDIITLESIAKDFFSTTGSSSSNSANRVLTVKDVIHGLPALMATIAAAQQKNSGDAKDSASPYNHNLSASLDPPSSPHSMKKMSLSLVTMLKVTKQLEGAAAEGAKRRKSLSNQGHDQNHPRGNHLDDNDDDDDGDDDEHNRNELSQEDAEAAEEERNRLRASELLARAKVVCSPVMFHPGKLRVDKKKQTSAAAVAARSRSVPNVDTSQQQQQQQQSRGKSHFSGLDGGNDEGGDFQNNNNNRRRSSVLGPPPMWHPSLQGNANNNKNNNYKASSSGLGRNSVVKQISEASNLSSGAKLYYLRQRLATLQQESEKIGKSQDGSSNNNPENVARKNSKELGRRSTIIL